MRGHLIQIDARDGAGAVTRYLASADHPSLCHLNAVQWTPAITALPSLAYDFFGGDFSGAIVTPSARFAAAVEGMATFTTLRFAGARVRIYTGTIGDAWGSFTLRFDGRIGAEPTVAAGIANFVAGPDDAWLDKPLLGLFLGTGGIEGPTDLTGTVKPLALGACRFAPGTLIDFTNNIYRVSGHGAVQGITAAYDRVISLGASSGNHADLAALVAASIASGRWATCHALGLARLGAPADGQVSFDVSGDNAGAGGYARLPGAIIRRIAELAGGTVSTANLAALDTARAWNLTLVLTAQTTAREAIQGLADSVCAVAGVTLTGTLFVAPLGFGTSSQTLKSDGTALPPVASVEVRPVAAPFWRLATEAEPTWVVHAPGSVASEYVLRGLYSATRTYRLDDLVESAEGSSWVYINTTASAGNAPPVWPTASNAWWSNVSPQTSATNAGTNFSIVKGAENVITVVGNTITQTASVAVAFNCWAYTEQSLTGTALVSAKFTAGASTSGPMIGLASPANKNASGDSSAKTDYGIFRAATQYIVIESGVQTGLGGTAPADSDVLSVFYDGVNVRYVRTTSTAVTVLRTVAAGAGLSFHAKATFDALGSGVQTVVSNIQFTPYTENNFSTIGGATKPENNADVTINAQVIVATPQAVKINADQYGTVIVTGQLPKVLTPTVTKGGVDKRTDNLTTYAIVNATGGCVTYVTVNNTTASADKGRQTIATGFTTSGNYDLEVTYNGIVQPLVRVTVTKENAAAATGGSGATKNGSFTPAGLSAATTGYVEVAKIVGLVKAAGETIRAYLDVPYLTTATATATRTLTAQWQYSVTTVNSWTAFATGVTGTNSTWNQSFQDGSLGAVTCNQTAAPADGTYDIRLVLKESAITNTSLVTIDSGTASVAIAV